MTAIAPDRPTRRETSATYRSRPLMVELHPSYLAIRQKGRRDVLTVDYICLFEFAHKLRWREQQAERKAAKKRGRR